ncbi:MAG: ABC transporter ATP-binding protein [Desulfobacteraceae bacterium]|jgi:iron complex transport system ATP-binding protein
MVLLASSNLEFAYNGRRVLKRLNFTLHWGQVMGVLGINGAGKSTLLKCLNRILAPRSGAVLVEDEDLAGLRRNAVAKKIGYVPQQQPASRLTVFETVLLGRKPHIKWYTSKKDYALVEKILIQLDLSHLSHRPVGALSGGELQKVAIARALAQTPKVLLLDEPTSNLDLNNQLEVMQLLRRIVNNRRLAAVIAIHDLNMALRFCDRLLFLKDHKVHAVLDKNDLRSELIENVYGVKVALQRICGQMVVVPL